MGCASSKPSVCESPSGVRRRGNQQSRDVTSLNFDVLLVAQDAGRTQTLAFVAADVFSVSGLLLQDDESASKLAAITGSGKESVTWCSSSSFHRWIAAVEAGYLENSYHNSLHACDVMTTANAYFIHSGIVPGPPPTTEMAAAAAAAATGSTAVGFEDPEWRLTQLALLIASAGHDVGHLGVMNPFLRQTKHPLTVEYPNASGVLEALHAATALQLMADESGCNILEHLSVENARWVRQAVVELILITDLTRQRAFLEDWNGRRRVVPAAASHLSKKQPSPPSTPENEPRLFKAKKRNNSINVSSHDLGFVGMKVLSSQLSVDLEDGGTGDLANATLLVHSESGENPSSVGLGDESSAVAGQKGQVVSKDVVVWDLDLEGRDKRNGRLELAKVFIKAADLSNPTKAYAPYLTWTSMVLSEFYDQGDHEAELGMPVTSMPQCDRSKADIVGDQMGFLNFVVKPAFGALHVFVEDRDHAAGVRGSGGEGGQVAGTLASVFENLDRNVELWSHVGSVIPVEERASIPIPAALPLNAFPPDVDGASILKYAADYLGGDGSRRRSRIHDAKPPVVPTPEKQRGKEINAR